MSNYFEKLEAAKNYVTSLTNGITPRVSLTLGSGLGGLADEIEEAIRIPTSDIPHYPRSTVQGHSGEIIIGTVAKIPVIVFKGRVHGYEGYSAAEVAFGTRLAILLGVSTCLVTNACGGINAQYSVGDLVLMTDHISLFCEDPAKGLNDSRLGPRFYDQTCCYTPELRERMLVIAETQGIKLQQGVYVMVPGPRYESSADIRALRSLGADFVAMSTIPEVLAARQMGVKNILGMSLITNLAAGIGKTELNHHEVIEIAKAAEKKFKALMLKFISTL